MTSSIIYDQEQKGEQAPCQAVMCIAVSYLFVPPPCLQLDSPWPGAHAGHASAAPGPLHEHEGGCGFPPLAGPHPPLSVTPPACCHPRAAACYVSCVGGQLHWKAPCEPGACSSLPVCGGGSYCCQGQGEWHQRAAQGSTACPSCFPCGRCMQTAPRLGGARHCSREKEARAFSTAAARGKEYPAFQGLTSCMPCQCERSPQVALSTLKRTTFYVSSCWLIGEAL